MDASLIRDLERAGVLPNDLVGPYEDKHVPPLPGDPWDHESSLTTHTTRLFMARTGSVMFLAPMIFMIFCANNLGQGTYC